MKWEAVSLALLLVNLSLTSSATIESAQSEVSNKQVISEYLPKIFKLDSIMKELYSFSLEVEKLEKQLNEGMLQIEELRKEKIVIENERNLTLTQMNCVTKLLASVQAENENLKKELDENVKETEKLRREKIYLEAERNLTLKFGSNLQGIEETLKMMVVSNTSKKTDAEEYILTEGIGYHKIYYEVKNWTEAREACIRDGAHLVIINSEAEAKLLKNMHRRYMHIGIHDKSKQGEWVTVLGEPLAKTGYDHWYSGQPNGGSDYNCGALVTDDQVGMSNFYCSWRLPYVCEIPI